MYCSIVFINQALYQGVSDATPPRPERKRERESNRYMW